MFFHDFSAARSLLHWCFPSRERRWPGTGWLYALWRNAPFVVVRKLPRRRTVTFSRERVLSEVESCERSWTIAFHARFLLARRAGRFPPRVSSWIASTTSVLAQLCRCSANQNWFSFYFNECLFRDLYLIFVELQSKYSILMSLAISSTLDSANWLSVGEETSH